MQLQQGWIFVTALGELVAYSDTLYRDDCEYWQGFQARSWHELQHILGDDRLFEALNANVAVVRPSLLDASGGPA